MNDCDALVVGGGPAGASAACLLARAGWKVIVVEKAAFPRRKVCGEYISGAAWPLLHELGVASQVSPLAGPEVTRVGLLAADVALEAPMPRAGDRYWHSGRALGREHLDTLLLERARILGACVLQPASATRIERRGSQYRSTIESKGEERLLWSRVVIAAHGAWEPGELPTHPARDAAREADLLGFKAHFRGARLSEGVMPLVLFPGGYGGLVHTDGGRVSFSCCIRRGTLAKARNARRGARAGEALLAYVLGANSTMRGVLEGANVEGAWLSAGPIRPAIRRFRPDGVFAIGNAAGEAHPIVAEGISMAIQSAFLLAERLVEGGPRPSDAALDSIARRYESAWRANLASRVHAAAFFARATMNPLTGPAAIGLLSALPGALTLGAHWSGKDRALSRAAFSGGRP